ncbi:hypothetical protein ACE5IS_19885 [Leptospira wolffii]|uniref:Uncharacterized protein n=1 Tax=Leptospira wolffii TaxID=409998 RepID=A0ABV5BUC6_9LEPT
MGYFEDNLLRELNGEITSNRIQVIEDNFSFFSLVREIFPPGFNRIDWSKISHDESKLLQTDNRKEKIHQFVSNFLIKNNISDAESIIYFGDAIDIALQMPLALFYSLSDNLIKIPQHSYILDEDKRWCFNYTFEDEMYIGKSEI